MLGRGGLEAMNMQPQGLNAVPRVEVERASVRLGGVAVLDGLSLDLSQRRIGVVGRNGSGKSTLARLLCGLIAPDEGSVRIDGVDVVRDRKGALRKVGILFQNPDHQIIFPTVEEEVGFGLRQLGRSRTEARDAAHAALARFGKQDWAARSVSTLSQGQRHLVCLIAVLAMEPAVVILDEPFTGLDIPTTRALRRHLDRAAPALIQITHEPAALDGYDRVVWIDGGRVHRDGPAAAVLDEYLTEMTREEDADAGTDLAG